MLPPPPSSTLFPYTTLFRSHRSALRKRKCLVRGKDGIGNERARFSTRDEHLAKISAIGKPRSEEHTSELQSQSNLVCRLLLERKKKLFISNSVTVSFHIAQY